MAQYIPAPRLNQERKTAKGSDYWHRGNTLRHIDMSVSFGTTGIGIDLATPLCEMLQLRVGYDHGLTLRKTHSSKVVVAGETAPQYEKDGNRKSTPFDRVAYLIWNRYGCNMNEEIDLRGKLTMRNLRVMLDLYPFEHKNWHLTAGVYWGPETVMEVNNTEGSRETLRGINLYNALYAAEKSDLEEDFGDIGFNVGKDYRLYPDSNNEITARVKTNKLKPYVGFGYGGRLMKYRDDWKIAVECGAIIWGGSPSVITHDGTDMTEVTRISGTLGKYMDAVKALKVYPQLSVRLTKTIF